jgi:hypothetical protein
MALFLARWYFLTAIAMALLLIALPLGFGARIWPTLSIGLMISAPISIVITWRELRQRNYWVLYDNLRIKRLPPLILCALVVFLIGLIMRMIE